MSKKKFPFENISLINLKGEKWKDILNYEGYYQVSNSGRIKALARDVPTETGKIYHLQEKIRKPVLRSRNIKTVDKPNRNLFIGLTKEGTTYRFSIARLVYYVFRQKFNLQDQRILISYKDHDGRNVHVSNLMRSDNQTIHQISFKLGRSVGRSPRPVTQFDKHGFPVRHYASVVEASEITGFGRRGIAQTAHGKIHIFKGYFWKFGEQKKKLDLDTITRKNPSTNFIHESLRKRLKIKVDPDALPPLLNLSTKTMKGERWKDAPGYTGLYLVSNFGRVKALQKITYGKQQKWRPEKIQCAIVDFRTLHKGKEGAGSVLVNMSKEGRKTLVSVARMGYYLFVKKFNLDDKSLRIYYKDSNPLNLHYKNLMLKKVGYNLYDETKPKAKAKKIAM